MYISTYIHYYKTKLNIVKKSITLLLFASVIVSCNTKTTEQEKTSSPLVGTWHLFSGTTIAKNDTVVTDYTKGQEMIKIINDSHFAFARHDLSKGKDTTNVIFGSGAGRYTLNGDQYTEYLDYCNAREWEGHTFNFTVTISNDTLIQKGIEKIEAEGIDRMIIEKYVKVK